MTPLKFLKNAYSSFFKDFRAPYLQRDTSYSNDTHTFFDQFFELFPLMVLIFQFKVYYFSAIFSSQSNFIMKEDNSPL